MKVLAILSQKGGVGKTTLATCLAVAAEQAGKETAIIDLDPQATASFWKDVRQLDTPAVASIQPVRLAAMLKACADAGTDLVVIDGAAVARDVAYEAARHADFILVPTKTAVFDTMSMTHTLDVVRQLDRAFAVVLTFVPPQGQETGDAMKAVEELGAAVCPVTIGNRKAFFRAQAVGQAVQEFEPNGPAAAEINRLYEYTAIRLYNKVEGGIMAKGNTLQAMLDRAKVGDDTPATPTLSATPPPAKPAQAGRQGTKLIGGHFAPEVSTQLRILAAEEGTTVQNLLGEALDDLFVKKGRTRVARGV